MEIPCRIYCSTKDKTSPSSRTLFGGRKLVQMSYKLLLDVVINQLDVYHTKGANLSFVAWFTNTLLTANLRRKVTLVLPEKPGEGGGGGGGGNSHLN